MFQFIRRHQAIGLIFIGIVIVSFVIFFSPNQGGDRAGGGDGTFGTIAGRPIRRSEYLQTLREVRLSQWLRQGQWPDRNNNPDWDEQREVFTRVMLLREAELLGVTVADDVAAARIVDLPFLRDDKTSKFNRAAYEQFLGLIQGENGMARVDFERFMRNEVALQHLVNLGGMSGSLVTPKEAETRFRSVNDHFAAQLVLFSATSHLAQIQLDPGAISQFYSNRLADYRIPERVQVRYIRFATTNFFSEADQQLAANTNLNQILDAEYQRRGAEAFRDPQGNPMTPEAAKADLKEQFRKSIANDAARKKANEFANELYRMDAKVESLTDLAAKNGLVALTSMAFDQFRPPADMRVPATFNKAAFALSVDEPFATPVIGDDGAYVYAFERRIEASYQPFETVKDRVTEIYKRTEARKLAETAGRDFHAKATNELAKGKSFEALATEAGLKAIAVTNFSRNSGMLPDLPPRITVNELLRVAADVPPGQVSSFVSAADGGFVMQVQAKLPVPDDEVKAELPTFLEQYRQMSRFAAFAEWERKRYATADLRTPHRPAPATNAPAGATP